MRVIENSIAISAPAAEVWRALTDPRLMTQWMAEPEMRLRIFTDWTIGSAIVTRGWHHVDFRNKGVVLRFEPGSFLEYSHLSSVSGLPDTPANYTVIAFQLTPAGPHATTLNLTVSNFPTESIFRHFDFYWKTTLQILRSFIEDRVER